MIDEKETILSREQYSDILARFRKDNGKCATNKWFLPSELAAMIQGGKLLAQSAEGTLWFFSDEGKYYNAQLFVPEEGPVQLPPQKKDVIVELTGKDGRYDRETEQKLLAAGFQRHRKYLELECLLDESIDKIREQLTVMRGMWEKEGLKCRKATKKDYPEMYRLWVATLDKERYTIPTLTDAQLDEMERYGRCSLICDGQGRIIAARNYWKKDKVFYSHVLASSRVGMGGWVYFENLLSEYEEGCKRNVGWIAEENARSLNMAKSVKRPTGKYFWQFIYRVGASKTGES